MRFIELAISILETSWCGWLSGAKASDAIPAPCPENWPRSWPVDQKQRFKALPYDVQVFVAVHEKQREKALRRAQNDAAAARREIANRETPPTKPDKGADTHETAANADP